MMEPFVSIIVPVYKVPEQYLRKCIESTMTQTLKKIEILLVDDGSPDQCGEICDEYAEKDKRIRVLHKKNGGLSSARNYGCKAAQGKWIMFVDGDDWIEPDMCQTMYSAGEEKQVQLVMCGIMKDYGKSATEYKFYLDDGKVYKGQECKQEANYWATAMKKVTDMSGDRRSRASEFINAGYTHEATKSDLLNMYEKRIK